MCLSGPSPVGKYNLLEQSLNVEVSIIPFTPSRINGILKENILEDRPYQSPVPFSGLPDFRVE